MAAQETMVIDDPVFSSISHCDPSMWTVTWIFFWLGRRLPVHWLFGAHLLTLWDDRLSPRVSRDLWVVSFIVLSEWQAVCSMRLAGVADPC